MTEDVLEGSASHSQTPDTPAASLPGGGREITINDFGLFFQCDLGSLAGAAAFSQHAVGGAPRLTPLIANPLLGCRTDPVHTCLVINSPAPPACKGHHEYVWMLHPLPPPSTQLASRLPALIDFTCNVRWRVNQGTEQRVFPLRHFRNYSGQLRGESWSISVLLNRVISQHRLHLSAPRARTGTQELKKRHWSTDCAFQLWAALYFPVRGRWLNGEFILCEWLHP